MLGKAAHKHADYFETCRRKRNTIDYTFSNVATETEAKEIIVQLLLCCRHFASELEKSETFSTLLPNRAAEVLSRLPSIVRWLQQAAARIANARLRSHVGLQQSPLDDMLKLTHVSRERILLQCDQRPL